MSNINEPKVKGVSRELKAKMRRVMGVRAHHSSRAEQALICFLETLADVLGLTVRHGAKNIWEAPPENVLARLRFIDLRLSVLDSADLRIGSNQNHPLGGV